MKFRRDKDEKLSVSLGISLHYDQLNTAAFMLRLVGPPLAVSSFINWLQFVYTVRIHTSDRFTTRVWIKLKKLNLNLESLTDPVMGHCGGGKSQDVPPRSQGGELMDRPGLLTLW